MGGGEMAGEMMFPPEVWQMQCDRNAVFTGLIENMEAAADIFWEMMRAYARHQNNLDNEAADL